MAENTKQTKPREITGILIKISDKTLKIKSESKYPHPKYAKIIKTNKNYLANYIGKVEDLVIGDEILIQECKPVSSNKTWQFIKVIKKAE